MKNKDPQRPPRASEMQAHFFTDRQARADFQAFDKIMKRRGGQPPGQGAETP